MCGGRLHKFSFLMDPVKCIQALHTLNWQFHFSLLNLKHCFMCGATFYRLTALGLDFSPYFMWSAYDNIFRSNKLWFSNIQHKAQKFLRLAFSLCLSIDLMLLIFICRFLSTCHCHTTFTIDFSFICCDFADFRSALRYDETPQAKKLFFCLEVVKNEHGWSVSMSNKTSLLDRGWFSLARLPLHLWQNVSFLDLKSTLKRIFAWN